MLFIVFLKLSILFIFLLICTSICFNPFSVFSKVLVFFKFSICLSFACRLADTVHLCLMIRSPGCLFTLNKGAWELMKSHHPLMQLTENPQKTVQSFGWQLPHSNLTMLLLWSGSILERHFVPLLEEEGLNWWDSTDGLRKRAQKSQIKYVDLQMSSWFRLNACFESCVLTAKVSLIIPLFLYFPAPIWKILGYDCTYKYLFHMF